MGQDTFNYVFLAIRGIQAGREYYVSMCPLKLISKVFLFADGDLPAELRSQRILNKARIPEMARYITNNSKSYVFSAITASIDGKIKFDPIHNPGLGTDVGKLMIPMTSKMIINDGQHRRAAIEDALKEKPELGDESIAVVFFWDAGLKLSQQMFADLNKHAVRPTKSLGVLYDHRDPLSELSRNLIEEVPYFKGLTDTEKTAISNRSIKLFTLSTIYQATQTLLKKSKKDKVSQAEGRLAAEFWTEVGKNIPEWELARLRRVSSAELRKNTIHAHGLALHALGIAGNALIATHPKNWKNRLIQLKELDWSRTNSRLWEGRALIGGRVSKALTNLSLTVNLFKQLFDLQLSPEEAKLEAAFAGHKKSNSYNNDKIKAKKILVNV